MGKHKCYLSVYSVARRPNVYEVYLSVHCFCRGPQGKFRVLEPAICSYEADAFENLRIVELAHRNLRA
jgi:hypothetical protein